MNVIKRKRKCPNSGTVIESSKFYVDFIDLNGQRRSIPAFKSKTKSYELATKIDLLMDYRKLNKSPELELQNWIDNVPKEIISKLISMDILKPDDVADWIDIYELLFEFKRNLKAKGCCPKHIGSTVPRIQKVLDGCDVKKFNQLRAGQILLYIQELNLSDQTKKHYLKCMKQFVRWLSKYKNLKNPDILELDNPKVITKERQRRPLTQAEAQRLMDAAKNSDQSVFGLTGYQTYAIYRLAIETGLRANEIRTLRVSDLNFEDNTLRILPQNEKARKGAKLPLMDGLAAILKNLTKDKSEDSIVVNIPDKSAEMIRFDLKCAKIEYKTSNGYADFHALRHTAATLMALNQTPPQICAWIMRHSDPKITQNIYSHINLENARSLVKMPKFD